MRGNADFGTSKRAAAEVGVTRQGVCAHTLIEGEASSRRNGRRRAVRAGCVSPGARRIRGTVHAAFIDAAHVTRPRNVGSSSAIVPIASIPLTNLVKRERRDARSSRRRLTARVRDTVTSEPNRSNDASLGIGAIAAASIFTAGCEAARTRADGRRPRAESSPRGAPDRPSSMRRTGPARAPLSASAPLHRASPQSHGSLRHQPVVQRCAKDPLRVVARERRSRGVPVACR